MYRATDQSKTPLYELSGQWSDKFTVSNPDDQGNAVNFVIDSSPASPLDISDIVDQDVWETRNAWKYVLAALRKGDMQTIIKEKTKLEEAQRIMRREELAKGIEWQPKFFSSVEDDPVFRKFAAVTGWQLHSYKTKGI